MPTLLFSQKLTVLIKLGTIVKVETNCLKCRQFNHFWPTDDVLEARGSNAIPIRSAQFKWKYYSSKRAVQIEILQFKARCSKITKIRGAQFKCKNNILAPSIGQNLQQLFLLYQQSCTESLREIVPPVSAKLYRIPTDLFLIFRKEGISEKREFGFPDEQK